MIHWKDCDMPVLPARRKYWRRNVCRWEIGNDGTCNGVGRSRDDDEPHDICKVCDRLRGDAE